MLTLAGQVLGLVGTNGIGKSTALKILAGKLKPNLGRFEADKRPDWTEIRAYFRGSELQNYFTQIVEDDLKAIIKPQYVDQIPKAITGTVEKVMNAKNEKKNKEQIAQDLDLTLVMERNIADLSGGELQRFAIAMVCIQEADVWVFITTVLNTFDLYHRSYMFDEPSSYLDVKQRLKTAQVIRAVIGHDLDLKQK